MCIYNCNNNRLITQLLSVCCIINLFESNFIQNMSVYEYSSGK